MANFSNLITTKKGHEWIARILNGESIVQSQTPFTRIVTSSRIYQKSELEALTTLSDIKQETLVSGVTKQNETTIKIEGSIDNSELAVGYRLNTVGVFFNPDGNEYLFGVAINVPTPEEPNADFVYPFNGLTTTGILFDLITSVGNADSIPFDVNPAATATIKQLREMQRKIQVSNSQPMDWGIGEFWYQTVRQREINGIDNTTLHQMINTIPYDSNKQYHITIDNNLETITNTDDGSLIIAEI